MTYRIAGLNPANFADTDTLATASAMRIEATGKPGFPCRVSLEDAEPGEMLWLVHHVSNDVATPYRSAYAIYVREHAAAAPIHVDCTPAFLEHRTLGLRGFDAKGMLRGYGIAVPGEANQAIRSLLENDEIAYVDLHNAGSGCYMVRAERYDDRD